MNTTPTLVWTPDLLEELEARREHPDYPRLQDIRWLKSLGVYRTNTDKK